MIVSGIACTPHAALQGHVLLAGAIDITKKVPLYVEHKYAVGEVTGLLYAGSDLYCVCELDDDEIAGKLNHFSVAGQPIHREHHDSLWHVSKFKLHEISLVRVPQNDSCKVLERKSSGPFHAWQKSRVRQLDLFTAAFQTLNRDLQQVIRSIEAGP